VGGKLRLKPLDEQVLVITGGSSGIGRTTALLAAERGARVVLAARDRAALDDAAHAVEAAGGRVAVVAADVTEPDDVERVARVAGRAFGGFDTWVNNAGVTVVGRVDEITLADARRLMDVNFWGVVHGCRAALVRLRERGGAIVTVGSALSDRAIPLQGMYAATKHAVEGYVDALRMELAADGVPVAVSLVKPASIDTPIYETARNYLDVEPRPVPPLYAPEVVARAILRCAVRPTRSVFAGGAGAALALAGAVAPGLADRVMRRTIPALERGDAPERDPEGNLFDAADLRRTRGARLERLGPVLERSAWTAASTRPAAALGAVIVAGLGIAALAARRRAHGPAAASEPGADRRPLVARALDG
jgi:short-subunit dehydrogenase